MSQTQWFQTVGQWEEFFTRLRSGFCASAAHTGVDMARVGEMLESKYLKKEDVPDPVLVTVRKVGKGNIAKEGEAPEYKWMMGFKEFQKPMILNGTNIQLAAKAFGSDDTDDWLGKQIELYTDDSVSFGGKIVGGLRLRGVRKAARAPQQSEDQEDDPPRKRQPAGGIGDMDDDIPF